MAVASFIYLILHNVRMTPTKIDTYGYYLFIVIPQIMVQMCLRLRSDNFERNRLSGVAFITDF